MAETLEDPPIYRRLMAVKPEGLTLSAWATRAGIHRSMFNAIRRHGNPTRDTIEKLLDAIDASWAQFDVGEASHLVRTEVAGTGMSVRDVEAAWRMPNAKPVPVLGSAIGGEYGDVDEAIELTELHLADVLDYVARPPSLSNDAEAYAVTIVGDSMAPRFEPGERAFVSPRGVPAIGDDVIVQLKGCGGEDGDSDTADRVTMVLIKRLVKRTARHVELRQFNPDATFQVPVTRIAHVHKVVGRL